MRKTKNEIVFEKGIKKVDKTIIDKLQSNYPKIPRESLEEYFTDASLVAWMKLESGYFQSKRGISQEEELADAIPGFIVANMKWQCRSHVSKQNKYSFIKLAGDQLSKFIMTKKQSSEAKLIADEEINKIKYVIKSSKNEKWVTIFNLSIEGYNSREIGEILNISPNNVTTTLNRFILPFIKHSFGLTGNGSSSFLDYLHNEPNAFNRSRKANTINCYLRFKESSIDIVFDTEDIIDSIVLKTLQNFITNSLGNQTI